MPKREDEIQKKLVELELSIKDEETKKQTPAAAQPPGTALSTTSGTDSTSIAEAKTDVDLMQVGGYGLVAVGVLLFLSHIQVGTNWWVMIGGLPVTGFLFVPLLIGIGMLVYNYKSRVAQFTTLGSFLAIVAVTLSQLAITFPRLSALDFVIMGLPLCVGGALLAKANVKRREIQENTKSAK